MNTKEMKVVEAYNYVILNNLSFTGFNDKGEQIGDISLRALLAMMSKATRSNIASVKEYTAVSFMEDFYSSKKQGPTRLQTAVTREDKEDTYRYTIVYNLLEEYEAERAVKQEQAKKEQELREIDKMYELKQLEEFNKKLSNLSLEEIDKMRKEVLNK